MVFKSTYTQSFNPDILILQYESVQLVHVCLPSEQKQEQFWLRKEWKNGCVSLSKNQLLKINNTPIDIDKKIYNFKFSLLKHAASAIY